MGKIRIAIDGVAASEKKGSGLSVFTRNLISSLRSVAPAEFEFEVMTSALAEGRKITTLNRLFWENVTLPARVLKASVKLLHVPAFAPSLIKVSKLVVTVHDLIGMLFPNQMGMPSAIYWGKWLPSMAKKADIIIADSFQTKMDLVTKLRIAEKKIRVIYLSGHEEFKSGISTSQISEVRQNLGITERYFLFVGSLEPRKNLERVLEAFSRLSKESSQNNDYQFVIVGSKAFAHGKYFQDMLKKLLLDSNRIIATDYIDQESLNSLYCGALGLIFPSLYEGFGMPILEAMGAGCPVLTSNLTSTPEVAGDASLLVNPYEVGEILDGMRALGANDGVRSKLRQNGYEQIKKFSWEKTARQTIDIYKELL